MFDGVEAAPPVKVFQLTADFKACTGPNKVNLGVGGKYHRFIFKSYLNEDEKAIM